MRPPCPLVKLLVVVLVSAGLGCESASHVGPRLGEDALVVLTSPVNLPIMAARDAALNFGDPGIATILFPFTFPLYLLEHTALTSFHVMDIVVFPAHFFHDSESLGIYDPLTFPMERGVNSEFMSEGIGAAAIVALVIGIPIGLAILQSTLQEDLLGF